MGSGFLFGVWKYFGIRWRQRLYNLVNVLNATVYFQWFISGHNFTSIFLKSQNEPGRQKASPQDRGLSLLTLKVRIFHVIWGRAGSAPPTRHWNCLSFFTGQGSCPFFSRPHVIWAETH